ncbi:uncharacterized protein BT62DRAFT_580968 [Guyanagaster necrorhizus]|uniref:Uncharacterized protein n=1 Tax=Guyanagaster necrorhizus TaxID=856835 RepID=A0A9P7VH04_9AGAR|nr:uncharacterized protein BT62DRAFT_580968 [Guyanagaster necrorhizus MCA 3950]KAG7440544.1 hypothetical protein BT62DRAFT_580968 [Guyanagaster necrorhizus MCA 3950]
MVTRIGTPSTTTPTRLCISLCSNPCLIVISADDRTRKALRTFYMLAAYLVSAISVVVPVSIKPVWVTACSSF